MTAPLISDATLAKIVRLAVELAFEPLTLSELLGRIVDNDLADALDFAMAEFGSMTSDNHGEFGPLIAALEAANEEAARAYDAREDAEVPTCNWCDRTICACESSR